VFPIRKGPGFGFDRTTFFAAGYAQFKDGSGWVGWTSGKATTGATIAFPRRTAR
jgi:hypothetical protein